MNEDKIIPAILATAMTDNRWTLDDAVDWVRRYRAILEVLRTEPVPDATDVTPILLWIESGGGRAAGGHRAAMHEAAGLC
jgi:hypothetical protein